MPFYNTILHAYYAMSIYTGSKIILGQISNARMRYDCTCDNKVYSKGRMGFMGLQPLYIDVTWCHKANAHLHYHTNLYPGNYQIGTYMASYEMSYALYGTL